MITISSPQYVWALFTQPITAAFHAGLPQVQITFSILIVVQTFLSPGQGFLIDRFGPRLFLSMGAVLTGLSWMLASLASSVTGLYLTYGLLGGLGTGIIYIGVMGHVVQWFPDRRGLGTGLVAAGYGMGAILFTFPIAAALRAMSYDQALWRFGAVFAIIGMIAAQGLRRSSAEDLSRYSSRVDQLSTAVLRSFSPAEMLRTPVFWLLFAMMSMMSTCGLMVTSQIGVFTADFGMGRLLVWGFPVLPLALTIDRITNGLTRPFFGWLSDRIGRENTMTIAFSLEGAAMTIWLLTREHPVLFVLISGVVFFAWGEIFSLFPSTLTDTFGTAHATANYGFLYIAQGVGSVLGGPAAALLHDLTGSWIPVFAIIIAMNFSTAFLAWLVLKPMRQRWFATVRGGRLATTIGQP
jgi:oxalate/formate antiporter